MNDHLLLSTVLFIPLAGAITIAFLGKESKNLIKMLGMGFSLAAFLVSVYLFVVFDGSNPNMQFVEFNEWIPSLHVSYHLGIDGMSLLLVVLTTFLTPISLLASWESVQNKLKGFIISMLVLEVGTLGVFMALDMFLFYVFWEAMLIPMYFIIGIWGGQERIYAAVKFFLYTMFGSLLMLVAILWLSYYASEQPGGYFTTNLMELYKVAPSIPMDIQTWMFLAFALSFCIKVPLFPLHTWLPDAHVQAPTAGSVILAGVLLKMGTYGLIRFCIPLFPYATFEFMPYFAGLAVIGIIYGALVSIVQPDMKKLVAYSSVSHLGFVVLGIFALNQEGMQGGIIQMINHGLSTGALFLLVGMIYDRRHTRMIKDFGGLAKSMPVYAAFFMIVMLSSVGLPGLNGFVGEFLILLGAFKSQLLANRWFAILGATGVVLAAVYLLWSYQRMFFGKLENPENRNLKDMNLREWVVLVPVILFIVWIGIYPSTFLNKSEASTKQLIQQIQDARRGAQVGTAERIALPESHTIE
ncbi:MAG: NADH-quinone oxidoreductase subunit M [Bacteroidetes bacterium]|nr:NADH-quinone oxidoreductase subunit M [Bacteroidota bacterium]MCW5897039.1 NADH-quinone oxidoreductase subunit M [Bacteroidota bacterium]